MSCKKLCELKQWQGKDGEISSCRGEPAEENHFLWPSPWFAICFSGNNVAQQQNKYKSLKRKMICFIFICSGKYKCQEPLFLGDED